MKILDHNKLHFSFEELGAFLGTYMMLKERVLTPQKRDTDGDWCPLKDSHLFNMSNPGEKEECGTVGCIGGNMAIIMGVDPEPYILFSKGEKKKLFYPPIKYAYSKIPIKSTLKAMENYARTGKAMWAKVLGNKYLGKV